MNEWSLSNNNIKHIDDIELTQFISLMRNLKTFDVSEKIDGNHLWFGIDEVGFYTSRESKGGKRVYNVENYEKTFNTTYLRSAHTALEKILPVLKECGFSIGSIVEIEVLFGKLPNVVPYENKYDQIVFIDVIKGNVDLDRVTSAVENKIFDVSLFCPCTTDGKTISIVKENHKWIFVKNPTYSIDALLSSKEIGELYSLLDEMEHFLYSPSDTIDITNLKLITEPLASIFGFIDDNENGAVKKLVKEERKKIKEILYGDGFYSGYIPTIKRKLLGFLESHMESAVSPINDNNKWIEGIVLKHRERGSKIKVVDKFVFTEAKKFIWKIRDDLKKKPRSLNSVKSFLANLLVNYASILGHPIIGTSQALKYMKNYGSTVEDILDNLSGDIEINDTKEQLLAFLSNQKTKLDIVLDDYFNKYKNMSFEVNSGNGKITLSYNDNVHGRTLQVFAELYEFITKMELDVMNAKTTNDLFNVLVEEKLKQRTKNELE